MLNDSIGDNLMGTDEEEVWKRIRELNDTPMSEGLDEMYRGLNANPSPCEEPGMSLLAGQQVEDREVVDREMAQVPLSSALDPAEEEPLHHRLLPHEEAEERIRAAAPGTMHRIRLVVQAVADPELVAKLCPTAYKVGRPEGRK